MKLDEWLFRNRMKQIDFARLIEISRVHLGEIVRNKRIPSVKIAKKIEQATEGKVTKEELLFPEDYQNKEIRMVE